MSAGGGFGGWELDGGDGDENGYVMYLSAA